MLVMQQSRLTQYHSTMLACNLQQTTYQLTTYGLASEKISGSLQPKQTFPDQGPPTLQATRQSHTLHTHHMHALLNTQKPTSLLRANITAQPEHSAPHNWPIGPMGPRMPPPNIPHTRFAAPSALLLGHKPQTRRHGLLVPIALSGATQQRKQWTLMNQTIQTNQP
jgi:hypothetical protein